jgi:hypothetical protein
MSVTESALGGTLAAISANQRQCSPLEMIFKLEKEVQRAIKKIKNTQRYN